MKNLIKKALGNCKFPDRCICEIKNSFERVIDEIFYVFDDGNESKNPVKVVSGDHSYQLTITNKNNKEIFLIKTDKCLITEEIRKCDCIISSDVESYLVEIKSCSSGTRSKARSKAATQLISTINYLHQHQISFIGHKLTALICFKTTEPRITQASRNSARVIFKDNYGVVLKEGNIIDF
jgi:hypothetical protein